MTLYYIILYYITLYYIISHYIILYHIMLFYIIYHIILCYVISYWYIYIYNYIYIHISIYHIIYIYIYIIYIYYTRNVIYTVRRVDMKLEQIRLSIKKPTWRKPYMGTDTVSSCCRWLYYNILYIVLACFCMFLFLHAWKSNSALVGMLLW